MSRTCHAVYLSLIVLLAAGLIYSHVTLSRDVGIVQGNALDNANHIDNLYQQTGATPVQPLTSAQRTALNERLRK